LVPLDRLPEAEEIQARIIRGERAERWETVRVKNDGTYVPVSLTNSPIKDRAGRTTAILTIVRDLTKRGQLEAEIVEIKETVQQQVGQDLHDGLSQRLRGIAYLAHVLQRDLADRSMPESKDAARITRLLHEALEETRNLASGLSPVRLDADGLMSGLKELAWSTRSIYGIHCAFVCPRPVLINQSATAIHLYRIAQEGIQNAIRHGKARRVIISFIAKNTRVELTVRDDGKGLPKQSEQRNGMGLKVMDYRARVIGAALSVGPANGGGTLLTCSLRIAGNKPAGSHM
jgi:signal transduction histidine kinase